MANEARGWRIRDRGRDKVDAFISSTFLVFTISASNEPEFLPRPG